MANTNVSYDYGTAIVWAIGSEYDSTVSGLAQTNDIDLTGLVNDAAREGEKADLGDVRPRKFLMLVAIEFGAVAPAAGRVVEFYLSGSPSSEPGNANPGQATGEDADYAPGGGLADSLPALQLVGSLIAADVAVGTVQYAVIGVVEDVPRFVSPIVFNDTDQALAVTGAEMYVALIPMQDVIED